MEKLPFDILNNELIYYIEPSTRANLGIVNKYNNENRKLWKKNFAFQVQKEWFIID